LKMRASVRKVPPAVVPPMLSQTSFAEAAVVMNRMVVSARNRRRMVNPPWTLKILHGRTCESERGHVRDRFVAAIRRGPSPHNARPMTDLFPLEPDASEMHR